MLLVIVHMLVVFSGTYHLHCPASPTLSHILAIAILMGASVVPVRSLSVMLASHMNTGSSPSSSASIQLSTNVSRTAGKKYPNTWSPVPTGEADL